MFAASRGITSRIIAGKAKNTDEIELRSYYKRQKHEIPLKQKFYIPFMWSTCSGCLIGLLILAGGIAMCIAAFYAEHLATYEINSPHFENKTASMVKKMDKSKHFHIRNLTYIGPIFMGVGAFVMVIACVVVFETRYRSHRSLLFITKLKFMQQKLSMQK